jgi:hypothetical protein
MLSLQNKTNISFTVLSKSNDGKTMTKEQLIKKNNQDGLFTIFKKQMINLIQNGGKAL